VLMMTKNLSFFETVLAFFDKAAAFTPHPPGLLEQIKYCNRASITASATFGYSASPDNVTMSIAMSHEGLCQVF
jgi:hypothetical protein